MQSCRLLSLLLSGVMLLTLLTPQAAAAQTYYGDVLVAINPNLSPTDLTSGSFTGDFQTRMRTSASSISLDPETGEELTILDVHFPELVPVEVQSDLPIRSNQVQGTGYEAGSMHTFDDYGYSTRVAECLYIGTHCTVWRSTDEAEAITINADIAQEIGKHFDSYYDRMVTAFGEEYDSDGDGKLAILCYDINSEYASEHPDKVDAYTAGFFRAADLADTYDRINGIQFYPGTYTQGMDCIHLDTFPGMGTYASPLGEISRSYSTLAHEFQHLINFSYSVAGGPGGFIDYMETYLDEAFAMAAEHIICGADACSGRIDYFNYSQRYVPGTALTHWPEYPSSPTLSHYSNSYLFGQYLRTRYGQLTDTDGSGFFKAVLEARTPENDSDTLALIAALLETSPEQLVRDFWAAVYLKQDSGPLGFEGEDWADAISPLLSSDATGIYNGGAKFYTLSKQGFTPVSVSNLVLLSLDKNSTPDQPGTVQARMETAQDGTPLSVTVRTQEAGYAMVAFYDDSGRMVDIAMAPITSGTNTVDLSDLEGNLANCTWKILVTDEGYTPLCEAFVP